jgi:ATP-dependent 26S proteasome regulatory subunit
MLYGRPGTKTTHKIVFCEKIVFCVVVQFDATGTGKTLWARSRAESSGLEFVSITGPAFDQFTSAEAIVEIKRLFKWANRSRKGLLLFVDEAEGNNIAIFPQK